MFVEPATAHTATGRSPRARSTATAPATGAAWRRNPSSVGSTTSVSGGKPSSSSARAIEKCVWSPVYTRTPSSAAPRGGPRRAGERPQVDVAHERHRDEVRHHAARREQPERPLAVPDEVAQPADDLLLDERADRSRVPDVDPLVRPLRQHLPDDRGDERRRREVRQRTRVVAVERVRRDPRREVREHRVERLRVPRRLARAARLAEVDASKLVEAGRACPSRGPSPRRTASRGSRPRSPPRRARGRPATSPRRGSRSAPARDASGTRRAGHRSCRRPSRAMVSGGRLGPGACSREPFILGPTWIDEAAHRGGEGEMDSVAGRRADDLVRRRAGRDGLARDRVRLRGAGALARQAGRPVARRDVHGSRRRHAGHADAGLREASSAIERTAMRPRPGLPHRG